MSNDKQARFFWKEGNDLFREKKYKEALEKYNKAIRFSPLEKEYYNKRGSVYLWLKKYDDAVNDFDNALNFDQDYIEAYENKGRCLISAGRYQEASKHFLEMKKNALDILILFPAEEINKVIHYMLLDENELFNKIMKKMELNPITIFLGKDTKIFTFNL